MNIRKKLQIVLCTVLVVGFSQTVFADEGIGQDGFTGNLKVMTYNLYVGADLFKIFNANPVPVNAAEIFGDIQVTDFLQRAEAIANLVAEFEPHLIGLQEVSLIRTQCPGDIISATPVLTPNATDIFADYLQILMDALNARGLNYEIAATVTDVDIELPVLNLGLLDCPFLFFDARLTDRDVTLRRSDVDVTPILNANFLANIPVPTPDGGLIVFTRGYNIVDVNLNGRSYLFANTHVEINTNPFATFFQFAQAFELTQILNGLAAGLGDEIVVLVGDLNSGPNDGPQVECFLPPTFTVLGLCPTAYAVMVDNGYTDTWTVRNGAPDDGFTFGQDDLLMNADSSLNQRIDHIWLRAPLGGAQGPNFLQAVHGTVVGGRQEDRTADGLWPSDHAGVATSMTIRQEK